MHRDHRFTQRVMPDALDQALTPRQRARFAAHVDECPECGPMVRGLIRLRTALRAVGTETADEDASVVPGVLERLHVEAATGAPTTSRRGWGRA